MKKEIEKQELAIKRSEFLKHLQIRVKSSQKTTDRDQLIAIETFNTHTKQNIEIVMRKLSELDFLVEYLNNQYGGHIIPFIKSDLYFQKNLNMEELTPTISNYLNDLRHNRYCRQDSKLYCFLIEQSVTFPNQLSYNKIMNSATDFSRKYLSSIFTRKQIPKELDISEYLLAQKNLLEVKE